MNTIDGPRNTSSSHVTPSYRLTLFCTFTFRPSVTRGITTTFCPSEQCSPITAPGITWQKCQIIVPFPTSAPAST